MILFISLKIINPVLVKLNIFKGYLIFYSAYQTLRNLLVMNKETKIN